MCIRYICIVYNIAINVQYCSVTMSLPRYYYILLSTAYTVRRIINERKMFFILEWERI